MCDNRASAMRTHGEERLVSTAQAAEAPKSLITQLRQNAGLNQKQLARRLEEVSGEDWKQHRVSRLEARCLVGNLKRKEIEWLAAVFRVDPKVFIYQDQVRWTLHVNPNAGKFEALETESSSRPFFEGFPENDSAGAEKKDVPQYIASCVKAA
jgi:transcriptional regulator with XRE-family HTH domain